ncbi:MAG: negative regulator of flagellin synthesis FlgM [Fimbriimonadaceae bacterium]|nr:negative regulator of flagellin synthesis FlgM [Fimbriimonadaceae bacterium]
MRISDTEIKKILSGEYSVVEDIIRHEKVSELKRENEEVIAQVTKDVLAMPDREAMVAELKARIEAGTYNPTGEEIADAMLRRAVADRLSEH